MEVVNGTVLTLSDEETITFVYHMEAVLAHLETVLSGYVPDEAGGPLSQLAEAKAGLDEVMERFALLRGRTE